MAAEGHLTVKIDAADFEESLERIRMTVESILSRAEQPAPTVPVMAAVAMTAVGVNRPVSRRALLFGWMRRGHAS